MTTPSGSSKSEHLAATVPGEGSPLEITRRTTPKPGPGELLIEVKAVALNPVDHFQRDTGLYLSEYPAVLGFDAAGIVLSAGPSVGANAPKPGTRIATFTSAWFEQGNPDYGALQKRVIVPAEHVVPLPDNMSFLEGATLPVQVATDKKGMLVWGGASSIGVGAVQISKLLGFTVYTTASPKHHDYLKGIGASRTFDYKEEGVEAKIIAAAKEDGLAIDIAYDAVGQLQSVLDVLKETRGGVEGRVASAPALTDKSPKAAGISVKFVLPPVDKTERLELFQFIFGKWLKEKLETKEYVPGPSIRIIAGGLEGAQEALDILKGGVSGQKLVLEL
ncbi:zinc-binding oxidoreductase-like protein CipB [Tothia fuscella]|uniref:Zinc-binding oxidoreductase-like protein CipB n=1 Tax=Tothia fuscella TaxID=1048955 RepID=A0A9P4NMR0_9PEZI|nr:zinc-binding oxidoreductase-like protein CipB [Tothia fuscella]